MVVRAWMSWTLIALMVFVSGCGGDGKKSKGTKSVAQRITDLEKKDAETRTAGLLKIAQDQINGQDLSGAETTLTLVSKSCKEIEDSTVQAKQFCELAKVQAGLKNKDAARSALKSGREAAEKITVAADKVAILIDIAEAQAENENSEGAAETLKLVEGMIGELKDEEDKPAISTQAGLFGRVAACYAKISQQADSDRAFQEANKLADSIEGKPRADALMEIATAQNAMGQKDAAAKTLDAAAEAVRKDSDAYRASMGLMDVAEKVAKLVDPAKGRALAKEADSLTNKIPDPAIQTDSLQRIRERTDKLPKAK